MIDREKIMKLASSVKFDEPMRLHTTFKIGGPADAFVEVQNAEEIISLIKYCKQNSIPYMIMGNGSNMLVSDKGIRGVVIQVGNAMNNITIDGEAVTAQAGVLMSTLANAI